MFYCFIFLVCRSLYRVCRFCLSEEVQRRCCGACGAPILITYARIICGGAQAIFLCTRKQIGALELIAILRRGFGASAPEPWRSLPTIKRPTRIQICKKYKKYKIMNYGNYINFRNFGKQLDNFETNQKLQLFNLLFI